MSEKPHNNSSSPHSKSQNKLLPYITENRRLTFLLQECNDIQNYIEKTKTSIKIAGSSSKTSKSCKNISSVQVLSQIPCHSNPAPTLKPKGHSKLSEAAKAVNSLISPISPAKHKIKRTKKLNDPQNSSERPQINYEVLHSEQTRKLLQCNKRQFGDHFESTLKQPKKKPNFQLALESFPKSLKTILSSPRLSKSRVVTQTPTFAKPKRSKEEKNLVSSVLNQNRKISHMLKMEKLLHEQAIKLA